MKDALIAVICVLSVFTAIGLACAVRIGLRRDRQADPFSKPFGEMPGFSDAQLRAMSRPPHPRDPQRRSFTQDHFENSAGLALRTDADGGRPIVPSWLATIGSFFRGGGNASA